MQENTVQNAGEAGKIYFDHAHDIYGAFVNESRYAIRIAEVTWPTVSHYLLGEQYPGVVKAGLCRTDSVDQAQHLIDSLKIIQRHNWDALRDESLYRALVAKFTQHSDLEQLLHGTGECQLIYASREDPYLGIGSRGRGHNMLGRLLMRVRRKLERLQLDFLWGDGAANFLEKAETDMEDDPENAYALSTLAEIYHSLGKFELAIMSSRKALSLPSAYAEWNYSVLARSLASLGRDGDAIEPLKELTRLDPEDADYMNWLSCALANIGKEIPAKFYARRARLLQQKNQESEDDGLEKW
jgi:N-glycosidase YbiA